MKKSIETLAAMIIAITLLACGPTSSPQNDDASTTTTSNICNSDADYDMDGVSDRQECLNNTDPYVSDVTEPVVGSVFGDIGTPETGESQPQVGSTVASCTLELVDAGAQLTCPGSDSYILSNGTNGQSGSDGQDGEDGDDGTDGQDGQDGDDGVDGTDGEDGNDGEDGIDGSDGQDGEDGADGEDGENGGCTIQDMIITCDDGTTEDVTPEGCEVSESNNIITIDCGETSVQIDVDDLSSTTECSIDDDNDGYGEDGSSEWHENGCDVGYVSNDNDCDDGDDDIHPLAIEVDDGVDNDCDGFIDEGYEDPRECVRDSDADGHGDEDYSPETMYGGCDAGFVENDDDCDDNNNTVYEGAPELDDNIDNDCDGTVDEGIVHDIVFCNPDSDEDGYGDDSVDPVEMDDNCDDGFVENDNDCDDNNNTVYEGATELDDGIDNDCDGSIDEGIDDGDDDDDDDEEPLPANPDGVEEFELVNDGNVPGISYSTYIHDIYGLTAKIEGLPDGDNSDHWIAQFRMKSSYEFIAGKRYRLSFKAKATDSGVVPVEIANVNNDNDGFGVFEPFSFFTSQVGEWNVYWIEFDCVNDTMELVRIHLGLMDGNIEITDIRVGEIN